MEKTKTKLGKVKKPSLEKARKAQPKITIPADVIIYEQEAGVRVLGRPTLYKPEYDEQAYKLCLLGATDEELGDFFHVDVRTINRWKIVFPEFCHSIKRGM